MRVGPLAWSFLFFACSSDPVEDGGVDAGPGDGGSGSGLAIRAGGPEDELAKDVAALGLGWVVVGSFEGAANFGDRTLTSAGDEDGFIAAYNQGGELRYALGVGGDGRDDARAVATLADGTSLVTGIFEGELTIGGTTLTASGSVDGYLLRISPAGQVEWAKRFGGAGFDDPRGLDVANDGVVLIGGAFGGRLVLGPGEAGELILPNGGETENGFVASFSSNGEARWGAVAGGIAASRVQDVVFLADGSVLVGGSYLNTITFGAGASAVTLTTGFADNAVIAHYGSDGAFRSAFQFGADNGSDFVERLLARSDGGYDVVGTYSSPTLLFPGGASLTAQARTDFFVARFGSDDQATWARSIGGGDFDSATGIAPGPNGGVWVAGHVRGGGEVTFAPGAPGSVVKTSPGFGDAFFAAFAADGTLSAASLLGGPGLDTAAGVAPGPVLVGSFSQQLAAPPGSLESAGGFDLFAITP
ncbi:MAG: hypothetical protein IPG45_05670 [Deltaproteobacteria bacterium]|nr:hypothetical protein [Deltaproteobacteria bacterium]